MTARKDQRLSLFVAGLALCANTALAGGMYKCTDAGGKPTFSQLPCAMDSQPVDVSVTRPTPDQIKAHQTRVARDQQYIDDGIARRQAAAAEAARQRAIANVQRAYAAEKQAIATRRSRANNNAAGAALEGALATDAAASDARFNATIDRMTGR